MTTKTYNWNSKEEFINKYNELKSSRKMAEYFNCSKDKVLKYAKEIGYENKIKGKLSEQNKQEILAAYYTETSTSLAEKYNVSRGMITKLWKDAGLSGKVRDSKSYIKLHLEGQKINQLSVIEPTPFRNASGSIKWLCKCDCGNYAKISSDRLKDGLAKSCGCLSKEALTLGRYSKTDLTNQRFGSLITLSRCENKEYMSGLSVTQWLCKCDCGNEIKVVTSNLTTNNTQSCGLCNNNSHGNTKIAQLLTEANIPYEREKRFNTCKDKATLPFDFFVANSYLIEFDGRQHFPHNGSFFGKYEDIHRRDQIKSNWCKQNNIQLIRIPYTVYKDLTIKDLIPESSPYLEN